MSIDSGFDPTRATPTNTSTASLAEEPVPHFDLDEPVEEGAPVLAEGAHEQPVEGARLDVDELQALVKSRAADVDRRVRVFVKEHPLQALAAAAAAGFLIGRILARR